MRGKSGKQKWQFLIRFELLNAAVVLASHLFLSLLSFSFFFGTSNSFFFFHIEVINDNNEIVTLLPSSPHVFPRTTS